ncbi:DUF4097 family beta strand repeat-containing protein [Streptomyces sp. NPDC005538]|uniref:DUF4097 family beta strand repeat-containing protein n=1 Tax=Streptomyces sp. NPDC005538 TaxID=3157043 RepID=UPI0033AE36E9
MTNPETNFEIVKRDVQEVQARTEPEPVDRILLAEAAKSGIEPLNTFTSDDQESGPVLATVTAQAATLWTAVDASVSVPTVRVYCADPNSPYAQAARDTQIQHNGNQLSVTVPRITVPVRAVAHGSRTYVSGSASSYSFSSFGDMHINSSGVTVTSSTGGVVINGHQGIEIELLLPSGSGLSSTTSVGSVRTFGHLAAAKIDASSGSVHLASVGRTQIEAASGSVRIGTVTEAADINAASGSVKVTQHSGQYARVRAASGSVTFTIAAEASGIVDVQAASGSVTLYGSHRPDMTVTAEAPSGTLRRC